MADGEQEGRPVGAQAAELADVAELLHRDRHQRAICPDDVQVGQHARGVAARLRRLGPDPAPELAEVHNRPDVALRLCRLLPGTPVSLFLHNDPQGMRGARSPAERGALLARLARVVTASDWLGATRSVGPASGVAASSARGTRYNPSAFTAILAPG